MKKYRFLLYQKALLAIIAILLPIAVTFYLGYSKNKEYAIKQSLADLLFIADTSENVVYYFLELHKRRAEDFASDGFIRDRLEKIVNGHELEVNSLNNHLSQNKKPLDNSIHDISIISLEGKIVSSTDPSSIGSEVSAEPFFLKGKTASSVTENGHGFINEHKLVTSTPVKHRVTGKLIGVLANFIPISELSGALNGDFSRRMGATSWESGDEKTTDVYLVNRDRFMITDSRFIKDAVLKQAVDTEPVTACIQSKHVMNGFYKDYRGVEVAGASKCFSSMGWTLLVEQDKDKVLLPLMEIRNDALLTSVIVISLISILFIIFNRAIVGPIKRLSSATNDILRGNYDIKVVPESGDEIGQLFDVFNEMAYEIKTKTNAFRDSEKKLVEAQRVGNIGSWEWDLINNKLSWHFEAYRILGVDLSISYVTFDSFLKHVHPDDRGPIKEAVNQAIDRKENISIDHRIIHPDGSVKMVHEEAKILFDETGRAVSMIGMVQDITKQKSMEEDLMESEDRFHQIFEQAEDAIILFRYGTTDIIGVNSAAIDLYGYSRDELIRNGPELFFKEDGLSMMKEMLCIADTQDTFYLDNLTHVRNDGSKIYVTVKGKAINLKKDIVIYCSFRNITKHKQAEEDLRRSEQRISLHFMQTPLGVIEWDTTFKVTDWNPAAERIFGYSKSEAIGHHASEIIIPENAKQQVDNVWDELLRKKGGNRSTNGNVTKEGQLIICEWYNTPLVDTNGIVVGIASLVQDITERKQVEKRLEGSRKQLHNLALHLQDVRENERKRIARDIHDDLGQILSVFNLELMGIKNSLQVDQKSLSENIEEVMKMADNAIDTVQRISSDLRPALLDDLGLFAALEWQREEFENRTGVKCELTIEPWDTILSKNITVAIFRIFQEALTNILRHAEATSVHASLKRSDSILTLEVIDNGKGITEDEISKSDSLGLLGIRERISPWNGELHIIGTAGKGTKLKLSVPLGKEGEEL